MGIRRIKVDRLRMNVIVQKEARGSCITVMFI